jgi:Carboxypeptidase regulatory-like domain
VAVFGNEEEHHMRGRWFFTVAFILIAASMGAAQENTTGSIAGRVVDPQSLPVPGAAVTVLTPQGSRTFTTDSEGRFFAPFLTPGQYEVKVELQGFKTVDRRNVDVRLGQRVDLTLTLDVGPLSESVQVNAASPIVDTSTTTTGAVIDSDTLYLAPGVSSGGQAGTANPSLSGGSGLENQYVVDGVITKSGSNTLRGSVFGYARPSCMPTTGFD